MLTILAVILSLFCFIAVLFGVIELKYGLKKIPPLAQQEIKQMHHAAELVSIVMIVKDEEQHIKQTIEHMLAQNYPSIEIIIVNDRSTDKTPHLIKEMAKQHSEIKPINIIALPDNWLGKNHAMYQGAKAAKGKWLLFLDGDVYFEKSAVSDGMHYLQQNNINNLTLTPEFTRKSFWLDSLIAAGAMAFYFKLKPWRAKQDNHNFYAGVGTYNLMLKDMYFAFDGHQSFPMSILDDVKLGQQLKAYGAKQQCLDGQGLISISWYETVSDMLKGTEKNSFAHCRFNFLTLIQESLLGLCLFIWPIIAFFVMLAPVKWLNLLTIILTGYLYADYAKMKKLSPLLMFSYPISVLIGTLAWWQAAIRIQIQGGTYWLGTFYSLTALKQGLKL